MEQKTIQRNWAAYNGAQVSEKLLAMQLISEAVDYLGIPYIYKGSGRPHIGTDDMLKCVVIKVFNNFSTRRTMCELRLAHALGYIREIPHFNSISNYMQREDVTQWLHRLYRVLALPLANVESTFAIDSTGFTLFKKRNWVDERLDPKRKDWKKLHIVTGVLSGIIANAEVSDAYSSDTTHFERMIRNSAKDFRIIELCADKGYISQENCQVVEDVGGTPYIKPRTNMNLVRLQYKTEAWKSMITMWKDHNEEFLQHYHKRSNVESTFSAMKRKFLPYVRSKDEIAQMNEILCKVVCHNASVLCNAIFELKVDVQFGKYI